MKKICITGGAGFIGSHLVEKYKTEGFEVAVIDDFSTGKESFVPSGCHIFQGSLTDVSFINQVFDDFRPHIVSHHAGQISVAEAIQDPEQDAQCNIIGALNVFRLAGEYDIDQVVFASSGGAILDKGHQTFPLPEQEGNIKAKHPYQIAKFSAEKYLEYFSSKYGFMSTVLRYANVYGPKGSAGVINQFISQIADNKPLTICGDGKQTRDFVYVEDVVTAHFLATQKELGGLFNIGYGKETSINALVKVMEKISGRSIASRSLPKENDELRRYCLDTKKFEARSGWKPKVGLEMGLMKTFDWAKGKGSTD